MIKDTTRAGLDDKAEICNKQDWRRKKDENIHFTYLIWTK
jgi:hypothetical protein